MVSVHDEALYKRYPPLFLILAMLLLFFLLACMGLELVVEQPLRSGRKKVGGTSAVFQGPTYCISTRASWARLRR